MSRGRAMRPTDFEQFQTTVNLWFGLRICSGHALAQRAGCNAMTIYNIRRGKTWTSNRMANEIMQAIGQIEQRYIKQWRDRRAGCTMSHNQEKLNELALFAGAGAGGGNQQPKEPSPNVASAQLLKMGEVECPVNCSDSELCTFLQALEEGFLPTYYSDTSQSAQSRSMSIASKSYLRGKKTVVFHGFQSLQMFRSSTGQGGEELLTWYLAGFPVKTLAQQERAQESPGSAAVCGHTWRGLSVRFCRDSSTWKTAQCLWDEDLHWSSVTLPRWGMTVGGECWERMTWVRPMSVSACGSWPTPQRVDYKGTSSNSKFDQRVRQAKIWGQGKIVGTIYPNPTAYEVLMGWPVGWTDLKPLEMGKCHCVQPLHGDCSVRNFDCWKRFFMARLGT